MPSWLNEGERAPDVSERMTWFPLVTFWQVALDLPGAVLSVGAIGLACYTLTSGVEHGWASLPTVASALGALVALAAGRAAALAGAARPRCRLP